MCDYLTRDELLQQELNNEYYGDCLDKMMGNPIEQLEDIIEDLKPKK